MSGARRNGRPIVLSAGGTGGHIFPAEALAVALEARGEPVELVTDERGTHYRGRFPARAVHVVRSDTIRGRSPVSLARTALRLAQGVLEARRLLRRIRPRAVVGFGGYPTVPPVLAAAMAGVPTAIHEQNAVMGRANRLLGSRVRRIALGFAAARVDAKLAPKSEHVGNPVRPAVLAVAGEPYRTPGDGPVNLLVFGGSQGARVMSEVVPEALARLDPALRARLRVSQQARAEDLDRVRALYAAHGVSAELAPFFADLPERLAGAHLVVCRSGASTVAELAAVGRPAVLVPLPHALDQDQRANAELLAKAGGAVLVAQESFTPAWLASELGALVADPDRLARMAAAARTIGTPDAAERLADLVLALTAADQTLKERFA